MEMFTLRDLNLTDMNPAIEADEFVASSQKLDGSKSTWRVQVN